MFDNIGKIIIINAGKLKRKLIPWGLEGTIFRVFFFPSGNTFFFLGTPNTKNDWISFHFFFQGLNSINQTRPKRIQFIFSPTICGRVDNIKHPINKNTKSKIKTYKRESIGIRPKKIKKIDYYVLWCLEANWSDKQIW